MSVRYFENCKTDQFYFSNEITYCTFVYQLNGVFLFSEQTELAHREQVQLTIDLDDLDEVCYNTVRRESVA